MVMNDPMVTHAALTLLEASIAHARGLGSFHTLVFEVTRDPAMSA